LTPKTPLRRDAERNRERILGAARSVFAAEGIEASMASVARAAGVGIATLFRRFPTRDDLINAVFACTMNTYLDAVTTALGDPDPWHGFHRLHPHGLRHAGRRPRFRRGPHHDLPHRAPARRPAPARLLQAFTAPQPATLPPPPDPSALARAMAGFSGPASTTLRG